MIAILSIIKLISIRLTHILYLQIGLYKVATNPPPAKLKTTTQKTITPTNDEKKELAIEEPRVQSSEQQISSLSQNESKSERPINSTDSTTEGTTQAKVDVPQHIIYMLIIGK